MEYLFDQWKQLRKKLFSRYLFLFFDYDGTLAPIAQTPQQAVIAEETKELLSKLSAKPNCALAIISGRSLKDIKHAVGLKNITYAGNHGLEMEGPQIKFESQVPPKSKSALSNIYINLISKLSGIKGVLIEDKGLTVSVHYRLVKAQDIKEFSKEFFEIAEPFMAGNSLKINEGKKVYEIRPAVAWNKGKTVLWLLARQQFLVKEDKVFPVYFGDDSTDEDAFKALKSKGLTIFVGKPGSSKAAYYVKSTAQVNQFMEQILDLK